MADEQQKRPEKSDKVKCIWRGAHDHTRWQNLATGEEGKNAPTHSLHPVATIHPGDSFEPTNAEAWGFRNLIEHGGRSLMRHTNEEMVALFGRNLSDPHGHLERKIQTNILTV